MTTFWKASGLRSSINSFNKTIKGKKLLGQNWGFYKLIRQLSKHELISSLRPVTNFFIWRLLETNSLSNIRLSRFNYYVNLKYVTAPGLRLSTNYFTYSHLMSSWVGFIKIILLLYKFNECQNKQIKKNMLLYFKLLR